MDVRLFRYFGEGGTPAEQVARITGMEGYAGKARDGALIVCAAEKDVKKVLEEMPGWSAAVMLHVREEYREYVLPLLEKKLLYDVEHFLVDKWADEVESNSRRRMNAAVVVLNDGEAFVGVAKKLKTDVHKTKIGHSIAVGRALKKAVLGIAVGPDRQVFPDKIFALPMPTGKALRDECRRVVMSFLRREYKVKLKPEVLFEMRAEGG